MKITESTIILKHFYSKNIVKYKIFLYIQNFPTVLKLIQNLTRY